MISDTTRRLANVAVVLAGGAGARVGLDIPKQLLKVAGRTILEHTINALDDCSDIDEIVVVMNSAHIAETQRLLQSNEKVSKVRRIIVGGADRNSSSRAALAALGEHECNVLFHDAVRPFVSQRVVRECLAALQKYEAVDVAIDSADTIIRVDDANKIVEIPDRSLLRRGQTPQGFRLSTIRRAYELAAQDPNFHATDDCGVVLRYLPGVPIHVVGGDEHNMKVTYPVDLFLADKLFQLASSLTSRRSIEDLRKVLGGKAIVVFGGSSGIGSDVIALAKQIGCHAYCFSRSATGTHIENADTVTQALEFVAAEVGQIDAVVVTAAQLAVGPLSDMSDEELLRQVQVNFLGPVTVARASAKHLRKTRGHLVLFTSSSYTRGRANYAIYSSAKAAVVNLAQALADEWSADGISVNVINPERTRTRMRLDAFGAEPEGSLLESTVVAATVLDVLASGVTGQVVDVRQHANVESSAVDVVSAAVAEVELQAEVRTAIKLP